MKRDFWLVLPILALAVFGIVVRVRMAGTLPGTSDLVPLAGGVLLGLIASFLFAGNRASSLVSFRWAIYALGAVLLAALIVFGRRYRGGVYLPGRLNPSELVKLCIVVWTAGFFVSDGRTPGPFHSFRDFGIYVAAFGFIALEILFVHDFGLLAQLVVTVAAMLFAASWTWGVFAAVTITAGAVCAALHPVGHLAVRFAVWRDPFADVTGSGWQTLQALTAVITGGIGGSGLGLGNIESIPIVSSDFVYAALAEELGLVGCFIVLALWGLIFVRGIFAAARIASEDLGRAVLITGIVASLAIQVILNVAGVLNVLPMTGITLPLVSHGGSSQAVTLILCGLLVGLTARRTGISKRNN